MSEVYKVIYTGKLKPGTNQERIIALFSEKFKLGPEKAKKLIVSGRSVALKRDIDLEKAEKYQESLEKLGLIIEIDPKPPIDDTLMLDSSPELTLAAMDNGDDDATEVLDPTMNPAADRCPKCGSLNMQMGICQDCGIVAAKYQAAQAREVGLAAQVNQENGNSEAEENPYTTPEAELVQPEEGDMTGPHGVAAGNGLKWIARGWWHFKQAPITWIAIIVVWFVLTFVLSMVPILGALIVNVLTPVLLAGLMIGCHEQEHGDDISVSHLFAGFANNAGQGILVGVFYLVFMILFVVGFALFMFGSIGDLASQQADPEVMAMMFFSSSFLIGMLVALLLFVPIIMAYLFAPALVALNDMSAWEAMKASFMGCMRNILPFFLYSLAAIGLMIVGFIPFGLGLLIVSPILIAALYSAYRDIYYR
ncbi:MAG: BPSS1780 family membrane protein [Candidatus Thiodiazotropha sp.]